MTHAEQQIGFDACWEHFLVKQRLPGVTVATNGMLYGSTCATTIHEGCALTQMRRAFPPKSSTGILAVFTTFENAMVRAHDHSAMITTNRSRIRPLNVFREKYRAAMIKIALDYDLTIPDPQYTPVIENEPEPRSLRPLLESLSR